jgi:excinuclease ABC subunit C
MKSIEEQLKELPNTSGVYIMKDENEDVLYVGKSKTLRTRVRSYFRGEHEHEKLNRLVYFVKKIDHITTDTHLDAVLLEIDLIKKYKPQFNSQFKKGNKYMFISRNKYITGKLLKFSVGDELFSIGPFRNQGAIEMLQDYFLKCAPVNSLDDLREFQAIPKRLKEDEFNRTQDFFFQFFEDLNKILEIENLFKELMTECSESLLFEKAKLYKGLIYNLEHIKKSLHSKDELILEQEIGDGLKIYFISDLTVIDSIIVDKKERKTILNFIEQSKIKPVMDSQMLKLDYQMVVYRELNEQSYQVYSINEYLKTV